MAIYLWIYNLLIWNHCLRLIKESVHKKSLKVSVSFDTLATLIVLDPRRFKQILINLLSNAVKFTPKGGQIGLEIKTNKQLDLIRCDKERCLDAGVNDYLSKPVSMRQLGKTVEQLLNRN